MEFYCTSSIASSRTVRILFSLGLVFSTFKDAKLRRGAFWSTPVSLPRRACSAFGVRLGSAEDQSVSLELLIVCRQCRLSCLVSVYDSCHMVVFGSKISRLQAQQHSHPCLSNLSALGLRVSMFGDSPTEARSTHSRPCNRTDEVRV